MKGRNALLCTGWITFGLAIGSIFFIFYEGAYRHILAVRSTSFALERALVTANTYSDATVVILGDSTAGHGFNPNLFNSLTHGEEKAVNLGMGGTSFLVWEKMAMYIRDIMPAAQTLILLMSPDQYAAHPRVALADMEYLKTRLNIRDIISLPNHFGYSRLLLEGITKLLIRPLLYTTDLRDLLQNPRIRVRQALEVHDTTKKHLATHRPEPQWENTIADDVCWIENLELLAQEIHAREKANQQIAPRFRRIVDTYDARKQGRIETTYAKAQFQRLARLFAKTFRRVVLVRAPVYAGFSSVFSFEYLGNMDKMLKEIMPGSGTVTTISIPAAITENCQNFMDVVHTNKHGSILLTEFLAAEVIRNNP